MRTVVDPDAEVFRHRLAAAGTALRRATGVHRDYMLASFFRFAGDAVQEDAPSRVIDTARTDAARQPGDAQVLVSYDITSTNKRPGQLPSMIAAAIVVSSIRLRHLHAGTLTALTATLSTCQNALQTGKLRGGSSRVARVFNDLAVRCDRKRTEPHVNADKSTRLDLLGRCPDVALEAHEPLARQLASHRRARHATTQWSVHVGLDLETLSQLQPASLQWCKAPRYSKRVVPPLISIARESWFLPRPGAPEKVLECAIDPAQCRPLHLTWYRASNLVAAAPLGSLFALVVVSEQDALFPPSVFTLVQCRVVEFAALREPQLQHCNLRSGWAQGVSEDAVQGCNYNCSAVQCQPRPAMPHQVAVATRSE